MKDQPLLLSRASQLFDCLMDRAQGEQNAADPLNDTAQNCVPAEATGSTKPEPTENASRHRTFIIAGVQ